MSSLFPIGKAPAQEWSIELIGNLAEIRAIWDEYSDVNTREVQTSR